MKKLTIISKEEELVNLKRDRDNIKLFNDFLFTEIIELKDELIKNANPYLLETLKIESPEYYKLQSKIEFCEILLGFLRKKEINWKENKMKFEEARRINRILEREEE